MTVPLTAFFCTNTRQCDLFARGERVRAKKMVQTPENGVNDGKSPALTHTGKNILSKLMALNHIFLHLCLTVHFHRQSCVSRLFSMF